MREIKFRAWMKAEPDCDLPDNYMEDWEIMSDDPELLGDMIKGNDDRVIALMQYTGLKDKNGKEIYEGDIIFIDVKENRKVYRNFIVRWNEKYGSFHIHQIKKHDLNLHVFPYLYEHLNVCEVLGNKFENPELLEVK